MSNMSQMFAHPGWALRDWIPKKTSLRGRGGESTQQGGALWAPGGERTARLPPRSQLWQLRGKYFTGDTVVRAEVPPTVVAPVGSACLPQIQTMSPFASVDA
jgi:hypothetical protein